MNLVEVRVLSDGRTTRRNIEIAEGDVLTASHLTDTRAMAKVSVTPWPGAEVDPASDFVYSTHFDGTDTEPYGVSLERASGESGHWSAVIPSSFTIDTPPANASRRAALTVTWSLATSDEMSWNVLGGCVAGMSHYRTGMVDKGAGAWTIDPTIFQQTYDVCDLTISLNRYSLGEAIPETGYAYGLQERTLTWTTIY